MVYSQDISLSILALFKSPVCSVAVSCRRQWRRVLPFLFLVSAEYTRVTAPGRLLWILVGTKLLRVTSNFSLFSGDINSYTVHVRVNIELCQFCSLSLNQRRQEDIFHVRSLQTALLLFADDAILFASSECPPTRWLDWTMGTPSVPSVRRPQFHPTSYL